MSKKQLISFLEELDEAELKEQLLDLYSRFKNVKEFYDFSFNPNEDRRLLDARKRINKEYFPEEGKKVRKRRSVAQKLIGKLQKLEADPVLIADLMLYNLEVAQLYNSEKPTKQDAFFKSMLNSFLQAVNFIAEEYLQADFNERISAIVEQAQQQEWPNAEGFTLTKKRAFTN